MKRVPVLLGSTGSGKTALVCETAARIGLIEVVVCDSRQIYAELPVTTAAPTQEERRAAAHHLAETLSPAEETSAFSYRELALAAIAEIEARGRLPLLVAGTGFYFRALKSMPESPEASREVRERVRAMKPEERRALLSSVAPERFEKLPANDTYRIARALEVALSDHSPRTQVLAPREFSAYYLDLPVAEVDARLRRRVDAMVQAGMVEEIRLVRQRYGVCPGLRTIGTELTDLLDAGQIDLSEFKERLYVQHRQYAKRQRTWFRKEEKDRAGTGQDFARWLRYFVDQDP